MASKERARENWKRLFYKSQSSMWRVCWAMVKCEDLAFINSRWETLLELEQKKMQDFLSSNKNTAQGRNHPVKKRNIFSGTIALQVYWS